MEEIDIIKALENSNVFEFIANNWWRLEKEELKDIAKELDYAIHGKITRLEYKKIQDNTVDNLKEIWGVEDE